MPEMLPWFRVNGPEEGLPRPGVYVRLVDLLAMLDSETLNAPAAAEHLGRTFAPILDGTAPGETLYG